MKKCLLTVTFLIITIGTFGQTLRYGLKAGFSSTKFVADNNNYNKSKQYTGFNLGGILDIGFGDITIQPGLLFISNGVRDYAPIVPGGTINTTPVVRYHLNYLQVP